MQNLNLSFAQDPNTLTLAIIYGMVPAIIWLFFWLRENKEHKRRHGLLVTLFFGGALSIILTLPVQIWISHLSRDENILNILWAASEEVMKFAIFALIALRNSGKNIADPIDYAVYIMTVALGFAGFENALYFLGPLQVGNATAIILSGSMRFLGTTLLHAACSCIIGISLGFAFFSSRMKSFVFSIVGLGVAITVHSSFNHYIVQNNEANFAQIFSVLWIAVIIMIFLLEILRRMGSIEVRTKKEHAFFAHIEELFGKVLAAVGMLPTDVAAISEKYTAKGFSQNGGEFAKLHTLLSSLRALYRVYLVNEGSDPKTVTAVALSTIPDTISAKALAGVIMMLKGEVEHEMEGGGRVPAQTFAPRPAARPIAQAPVVAPSPVPIPTPVPRPVVPPVKLARPVPMPPAATATTDAFVPIVTPKPKPIEAPTLGITVGAVAVPQGTHVPDAVLTPPTSPVPPPPPPTRG